MIVRELLTRIGYDVDPKAEKKAKAGFARVRDAAGKLGLALSAGLVAAGFKRMIDAASDVEETMNVVTTAFEDQADAVLKWAEESGEAAGRSQFAMREYAAVIGAVVGPTLGSAEATAELSTNMAQLAVDLGSFFNATDQEALDALRAGLIGSSEPMLRFGVNMNVAALEAFRLSEGISTAYKDMTEAQKIQLRYQFILARTTKAQGDAEKTAGGFANQVKRLQGNLHDIAVAIGKQFLPGAADVLVSLNDILKIIKGPLVSALRLIAAPFKLLATIVAGTFVTIAEASTDAKLAMFGLTVAMVAYKMALKPVLALKALLALKFIIIGALIAAAILIIEDLWVSLTGGKGVIGGLVDEFKLLRDENDSYADATRLTLQTALDHWIHYFTGVEHGSWRMGEAIRGSFRWIGDGLRWLWDKTSTFITEQIDVIRLKILGLLQIFSDKLQPVIDGILDTMVKMSGIVTDLGLGDILGDFFGAAGPERIAIPGSPAAAGRGDVNAPQTIEVNVNAPGNDGPGIAGAVAPAVGNAAAAAYRRTGQQIYVGAPP